MKHRMILRFPMRKALGSICALVTIYLSTTFPVYADSSDCDRIGDYGAWADCVRKSSASSDETLNRVYRRVLSKLKGSTNATKLLVTAQRQWIAFRDAQCQLESLAADDGGVHPTAVAACADHFASQRTEYLFSLLTCKESDLTCLMPTHFDASSEMPRAAATGQLQHASSRGIPFESPDIIEDFKVSGLWFPEQSKPYVGLSGAAIFNFSGAKTGEALFSAAVNGVALLPKDYWKNNGVADPDSLDVAALVEKLKASDIIEIRLLPETRAKILNCDPKGGNQANSNGDKCLQFGEAVVDIQDVDFDGKKELVFRLAGESQRGVEGYQIMEPYESYFGSKGLTRPLSELDQMSKINLSKYQITLRESNGACNFTDVTYTAHSAQSASLKLTHVRQYSTDPSGTCYIEDYSAEDQLNGEGYCFKLISRKLAK